MRSIAFALLMLLLLVTLGAARGDEDVCLGMRSRVADRKPHLFYIKSEQRLCLVDGVQVLWQRSASHGRSDGKKQFEGDERTPEGHYSVAPARSSKRFGLFLAISYPNAEDTRRARALGKQPGGSVGIHGPQRWYAFLGRAQSLINHSDGCIVLDVEGIQQLARLIKKTTPIDILPSVGP